MSGSSADFLRIYYSTLVSGNMKLRGCGGLQTLQLSVDCKALFHYQRQGKLELDL